MGLSVLPKTYEHTEAVAANVWNINHGLGTTAPVVEVILDSGQPSITGSEDEILIAYDVTVVDANNVTVTLFDPSGSPTPAGATGRALVA